MEENEDDDIQTYTKINAFKPIKKALDIANMKVVTQSPKTINIRENFLESKSNRKTVYEIYKNQKIITPRESKDPEQLEENKINIEDLIKEFDKEREKEKKNESKRHIRITRKINHILNNILNEKKCNNDPGKNTNVDKNDIINESFRKIKFLRSNSNDKKDNDNDLTKNDNKNEIQTQLEQKDEKDYIEKIKEEESLVSDCNIKLLKQYRAKIIPKLNNEGDLIIEKELLIQNKKNIIFNDILNTISGYKMCHLSSLLKNRRDRDLNLNDNKYSVKTFTKKNNFNNVINDQKDDKSLNKNEINYRQKKLGKRGGIIDLTQVYLTNKELFKTKITKIKKISNKENTENKENAAKIIQDWWKKIKEKYNNIVEKIIRIQSLFRGNLTRKYSKDILYLNFRCIKFNDRINKTLVNHVRPEIWELFFSKKIIQKESLSELLSKNDKRYTALRIRPYFMKWYKNVDLIKSRILKCEKLLTKKDKEEKQKKLIKKYIEEWFLRTYLNKYKLNEKNIEESEQKYYINFDIEQTNTPGVNKIIKNSENSNQTEKNEINNNEYEKSKIDLLIKKNKEFENRVKFLENKIKQFENIYNIYGIDVKKEDKIENKENFEKNPENLNLIEDLTDNAINRGVLFNFDVFIGLNDKIEYLIYNNKNNYNLDIMRICDKNIIVSLKGHNNYTTVIRYHKKNNNEDYILSCDLDKLLIVWDTQNNYNQKYKIESKYSGNILDSLLLFNIENKDYIILSSEKKEEYSNLYELKENTPFIRTIYDTNNNETNYLIPWQYQNNYYIIECCTNKISINNMFKDENYATLSSKPEGKHLSGYIYESNYLCVSDQNNNVVRIWDLVKKEILKEINYNSSYGYEIISWNNKYTILGCYECFAIVNIEEGKIIRMIDIKRKECELRGVKKIKTKKFGECLICSGNDNIIRVIYMNNN